MKIVIEASERNASNECHSGTPKAGYSQWKDTFKWEKELISWKWNLCRAFN